MCYSAEVKADYKKYVRLYGADIDIETFYDLYWRQARVTASIKTPKLMDDLFAHPESEREREIKALIDERNAKRVPELEQDLFAQRKRLADAERKLATKVTKTASEEARKARNNIEAIKGWLSDLSRTEPLPKDGRIFPGNYAPVIVMENGRRVVKPMRYRCRPEGKPAFYDSKYPGIYNARRDNLEGFWKDQFGHFHGILIASRFFEHVKRHAYEGRPLLDGEKQEDLIIEFKPEGLDEMLVACVWSCWTAPGEPDLLSFAAITDDPPPEIAAVGHDRCVIPLKPENMDAWLQPDPNSLADQYAILDDRQQAYYQHRLAA
jgi:putative SOS response-associated peptidase YedK